MLIPDQKIKTKWHYTNKEYYKNLGYEFCNFGDTLYVSAEDLNPTSHLEIEVKCDICGKIIKRSKRRYLECHDDEFGDTCQSCNKKKKERTNLKKYGAKWALQTDESKEKQKQTCLERYGKEYASQTPEFREKVEKTCLEKYGVTNVSMDKNIREKINQSMYANGSVPDSKPQRELYDILIDLYGKCEYNYPFGDIFLDCYLEIDGVKIDVEYDGWYWHKDKKEKDKRRNYFLLNRDIKIYRISSKGGLPSKEEIKKNIDLLVNTDKKIIIQDMLENKNDI